MGERVGSKGKGELSRPHEPYEGTQHPSPAKNSPFQPLPLQETIEIDAVKIVSKGGHAQVLVGQPVTGPSPPVSPRVSAS